jgi:signal peptidase I
MPVTETPKRRRLVLYAAAALFVLLLVGRVFVLEPITIASDSMRPHIMPGSHALLLKTHGASNGPNPDDLVVFNSPDDGTTSLKRVIAVAGQEIAIRDGVVFVDGVLRLEPGIDPEAIDATYFGPIRVQPDTVFVLGDNRGPSIDSRDYGPVPLDSIRGSIVLVWN